MKVTGNRKYKLLMETLEKEKAVCKEKLSI
jgi:hypothetical protein